VETGLEDNNIRVVAERATIEVLTLKTCQMEQKKSDKQMHRKEQTYEWWV
jgi:hypothetical protein